MASFTISVAPWPVGRTVSAYPIEAWADASRPPTGAPVSTGVVDAANTVVFGGLADRRRYVAYADGQGVRFAVATSGLQTSVATPDRERIKMLEDAETGTGTTADTFEEYRIIMLSNGTVRAIPVDAVAPATPAGFTADARLTSVTLSWTPSSGAASYVIQRDGVQLGTTTSSSYRDRTVLAGATYAYRVAALDQYGQQSPFTVPVSAFINPALNSVPVVEVTAWPPQINPSGTTILRVNADDVDAQVLALQLNVSAGLLQPTADRSVWLLTI